MKLFLIIGVLVVLTSCGASVSYVGRSYPETSRIDLYMSWEEVTKAYEIAGYAESIPYGSTEKAQQKLEEVAKKKGADGIVFEGFNIQTTDPVLKAGKKPDSGENTITVSQPQKLSDLIRATFIKYK
jgi:hypothetical protein